MNLSKTKKSLAQIADEVSLLFGQRNEQNILNKLGLFLNPETGECEKLKDALALLEEENKSLALENNELHSRIRSLEFEPDPDSRQYYMGLIKDLQKRIDSYESDDGKLVDEVNQLENACYKLENENTDLNDEILHLKDKIEELEQNLENYVECKTLLNREEEYTEKLRDENETLIQENEKLKEQLENFNSRYQSLLVKILEEMGIPILSKLPDNFDIDRNRMFLYEESICPDPNFAKCVNSIKIVVNDDAVSSEDDTN